MIHFHGICHGKFDLRYFGGFLEFRKSDLRGLKGQFNVKIANFGGLIAIGQFWLLEPKNTYSELWNPSNILFYGIIYENGT